MDELFLDIPRFYTALAEWTACGIYLILLSGKRRFSKVGTMVISGAALMIQSLFLILTGSLPTIFWIPCMILAVGFMYFYLMGVCRVRALEAGYCCTRAFLLAEFAASLEWQLHTYLIHVGAAPWSLGVFLLPAVYGVVFAGAYFLEKAIFSEEYMVQLTIREFISAAGVVVVAFSFSNLSFIAENTPFTSSFSKDIFNIRTLVDLGGVAVLYAFQSRIGEYIAEREKAAIDAVLKSQYEQYRNYQDSMELIHMKYHDLKHQIAGLRAETDVEKRKEWLDAMEQELEAGALLMKTGNSVLDTILGAKILYARGKGIRITCVADGTLLNFIHVTDICTIFGNALDNAVESVILLENPQMRLIHVTVSAQRSFVFIQVSNYCEQEIQREIGQMPATTKSDKKNHGYGLKSIRYSVEKYGGSVAIDLRENWFELRILIPQDTFHAENGPFVTKNAQKQKI